jgi:hypothetical protein
MRPLSSLHPLRVVRSSGRRTRLAVVVGLAGLLATTLRAMPADAAVYKLRFVTAVGRMTLDDYDDGTSCAEPIAANRSVQDKTVSFSFKKSCGDITGEVFFTIRPRLDGYVDMNGWAKKPSGTVELGWRPMAASIPDQFTQHCGPVRIGESVGGAVTFDFLVITEFFRP